MGVFEYKGFSEKGRGAKGYIDADSIKAAKSKLRKAGIFPTEITQETKEHKEKKAGALSGITKMVPKADVALMTRQLATVINAGLPMIESLSALIEQLDNIKLKRIITSIRERVNEGTALADAFAGYPRVFSNIYVNMVRAGEASGALDVVLLRLADFQESQVKLVRKIKAIFAYPILMMFVGIGVLSFLLTYVIPKVTKIFNNYKKELPLPTKLLIGTSNLLRDNWFIVILLIILAVYFIRKYLRTTGGRQRFDNFVLMTPAFGKLTKKIIITRFSRTLSTILKSGIPLLTSMNIVKNIVNNVIVQKAIGDAAVSVREGESIAVTLRSTGVFPPLVTRMIAVGEKTGELEDMLDKVADAYESEVEAMVLGLTSVIEPLMILVMGGVVAFIVISILLPIFELNQINM